VARRLASRVRLQARLPCQSGNADDILT